MRSEQNLMHFEWKCTLRYKSNRTEYRRRLGFIKFSNKPPVNMMVSKCLSKVWCSQQLNNYLKAFNLQMFHLDSLGLSIDLHVSNDSQKPIFRIAIEKLWRFDHFNPVNPRYYTKLHEIFIKRCSWLLCSFYMESSHHKDKAFWYTDM